MSIHRAARRVLEPHIDTMRSYLAFNPMPAPKRVRVWPTATWVWRRYLSSMITSMTRSTPELWQELAADPEWRRMGREGPAGCPNQRALSRFLRHHGIRFANQKAARLRRAVDRPFERIADELRDTFARVHDRRRARDVRRREEVRLAELLQDGLAGCGVAPKIARLALLGAREITQIIPIDSRWMTALREHGADVTPAQLSSEQRYRDVEDVLVQVSYELGVTPAVADGIPFGWLLGEGV
jgi:hypothetical protein